MKTRRRPFNRRKLRNRDRLRGLMGFIFLLIFLSAASIVAFYLSAYIYRLIDWSPDSVFRQMINSILGFFLIILIFALIRKIAFTRYWVQERDFLGPIIEALEKIAKGDFSIRLQNEFVEHQRLNELSSTVNKMALELGQMENMRQEFISNVSHEIQTPLTSISGFAEALENEQLSSAERQHYLNIIKLESRRLSRLSDNLLKLAALESETIKFEPQLYRLDEQLRNLILSCEPQWQEKKIEMELFLEEISITADKDMLSQIWINLITNSIKYTPEGGEITVNLYRQSDRIIVEITDTGIGIAREDQKHIFERFYKTDKSRQPSQKGNGLGLSIVKKIIDLHQGEIMVSSSPGEGTVFSVYLPVKSN